MYLYSTFIFIINGESYILSRSDTLNSRKTDFFQIFLPTGFKGWKPLMPDGGGGLGWRDRSSQGLALMSGSIPGFHKVRPPSPPPPFCPDARFVLLTGEGGQAPASSRWIKYLAGLPHALPPGPNHHINTCRDRFSMMRLIFALWQVQSALWRIASKSRSLLLDRFWLFGVALRC